MQRKSHTSQHKEFIWFNQMPTSREKKEVFHYNKKIAITSLKALTISLTLSHKK